MTETGDAVLDHYGKLGRITETAEGAGLAALAAMLRDEPHAIRSALSLDRMRCIGFRTGCAPVAFAAGTVALTVIDASYVCQLGYAVEGIPVVTPTCHWRIGDHVYWHGSSASRMLRAMEGGTPVCFSVTLLDGIVFSRAAFNHNVLYRSVMAFGTTELVPEAEKRDVLEVFVNRLAPGLWQAARAPAEQEWKASKVIRMKLDEVSAKVTAGLPDEDEGDLAGNAWAGHVPIWTAQGAPVPDPKLRPGIDVPDYVRNFRYPGARD